MKSKPKRIIVTSTVIMLIFIVLLLHTIVYFKHTNDDAFITFRYVKNVVLGRGLVYNPNSYIEGYSNPLLVFILIPFAFLGLDIIIVAKLIGFSSLIGIICLVVSTLKKLEIPKIWLAVSILIIAANWNLIYYSTSGLETLLFTFLLLLSAYIFINKNCSLSIPLSILLVLLSITRPEGFIYIFTFVIMAFLQARRSQIKFLRNRTIIFFIIVISLIMSFFIFRYFYFGKILPQSFHVKVELKLESGWKQYLTGGFDRLLLFFQHIGGFPLILYGSYILLKKKNFYIGGLVMVFLSLSGMIFNQITCGDWMVGYRFLIPILPFILIMFIVGMDSLTSKIKALYNKRKAFYSIIFIVTIYILGVNSFYSYSFYKERCKYPNFVMTSVDMITASKWIGDNFPKDYKILCWRIGALGYYTDLTILDTIGLVNDEILKYYQEGDITKERLDLYIIGKKPELIISDERSYDTKYEMKGDIKYIFVKRFPQGSDMEWNLFAREDVYDIYISRTN